MNTELLLGVIAFSTSLIAAIVGFGGGMLLIAILPILIAPALVIPIHGITQIASNASRAAFSFSYVKWSLFPVFLVGSIAGTFLFGLVLYALPTTYIPLLIGAYLLLNLWHRPFADFIRKFESYHLIGQLQTGLGLFMGATGPLSLSVLTKELKSKDEVVATSAVFMTISHLTKIPVFMLVTHMLWQSLELILGMVLGSILGSFVGTKLRLKASNAELIAVINLLLTLLALHMIFAVFA
ncbi:membrane protein [Pseudoalteromonas luteoviolacea]|nr:membrane protein [Pseudoalteromonas luteoviolacea]